MAEPRPLTEHGRPHGKVSSWVLVSVVAIAFAVGGAAMILHVWWLFWACVAVCVLSVPVGMLIGIMEDTVGWTMPMSATQRRSRSVSSVARTGQAEDPGGEGRHLPEG